MDANEAYVMSSAVSSMVLGSTKLAAIAMVSGMMSAAVAATVASVAEVSGA